MAMMRVCDVCGKLITPPHKRLRVLAVDSESTEPRNYKTAKSLDMHDNCYSSFLEWLKRTQEKAAQFKDLSA